MAKDLMPQRPDDTRISEDAGTGTENIVRRHLQDPNHVITDEEIRNVQVGKSDEVPTTGAEAMARFEDETNNKESDTTNKDDGDLPEATPPNPWDVLK